MPPKKEKAKSAPSAAPMSNVTAAPSRVSKRKAKRAIDENSDEEDGPAKKQVKLAVDATKNFGTPEGAPPSGNGKRGRKREEDDAAQQPVQKRRVGTQTSPQTGPEAQATDDKEEKPVPKKAPAKKVTPKKGSQAPAAKLTSGPKATASGSKSNKSDGPKPVQVRTMKGIFNLESGFKAHNPDPIYFFAEKKEDKEHPYYFLSNFSPSPFLDDGGQRFETTEQ